MSSIYLQGLNGVRAIAATLVLAAHTSSVIGIDSHLGAAAVTVFFTLSGFLITYLLLVEKNKENKIDIKKFYIRRVLGIWPLYFTYLLLLFLYNGYYSQNEKLFNYLYYIFFIPNYALAAKETIHAGAHYWSLGVEEQFYVFWPLLIAIAPKEYRTIAIFTLFYVALRVFFYLHFGGWSWQYSLLYLSKFDAMAIGGLAAYIFKESKWGVAILSNIYVHILAWVVTVGCISSLLPIPSIANPTIFASAVAILLVNQVAPSKNWLRLEHKIFTFLGLISFGMYVYHPLVQEIMPESFFQQLSNYNLVIYCSYFTAVFIATIIVSYLSYRFLEMPFLRLKAKAMVIQSSNQKT